MRQHPNSCIQINKTTFVEGYWSSENCSLLDIYKDCSFDNHNSYSDSDSDDEDIIKTEKLPFPIPGNKKYRSELTKFIKKFKNIPVDDCNDYDGYSRCRLCGCENGSEEWEYTNKETGIKFIWPDGLIHYYVEHDVFPSERFYDFVLDVVPEDKGVKDNNKRVKGNNKRVKDNNKWFQYYLEHVI